MFKDLKLLPVYKTGENDIPKEFYNPILKCAIKYDRTSAYFSAQALSMYSEGLEYFSSRKCKYRLIISHDIDEDTYSEIKKGYDLRKSVSEELVDLLNEKLSDREEMNLSNLAYFIANGTVEIKIAFKTKGIFHDKCGLMEDEEGNVICFRGSNNETEAAISKNYESFQLTCSWLDSNGFYLEGINQSIKEFEDLWNNRKENLVVLPADEVVIKEIIKHNKGKIIMEEKLLKPNTIILDYDVDENQLIMHFNIPDIEVLKNKTFFKIKLERKIDQIAHNIAYFNKELVYPEFIQINKLLSKKIPAMGINYDVTNRLLDYIEERNLYIEKRASVGIELKTDISNLNDKYEEFKNIVNDKLERKLREKQMKDAFFMCAMMRSGNFSVPGSGKTTSAIAVYGFLKARDLVDKIVMIGPKNAFDTWVNEFRACMGQKEELDCFNIQDSKYNNIESRRTALKYDSANCNLFLINYEALPNYVEEVRRLVSNKGLLIFDEVHKVKAVNGQRAAAALEVSKYSTYTIAMTGTPIPNSYLDLYNFLHILYNDEYKEFFGFDNALLRNPSPTDIEFINEKIQPFFCRTTKQELMVPNANEDITNRVRVTIEEQNLFDIVRKKYKKNKLVLFIRLLQLESNPRMLLQKISLSDFSDILDVEGEIDEIDFVDYAIDVQKLISKIDITTKKKVCIDLVKKLVGEKKKVIIWCIFIDSINSLNELLNDMGIKTACVYGKQNLEERKEIIEGFKGNEYDVLITNPHTLAESVSLHMTCHDAIYFEYSYNLVHLLQSKDRIHRLGLKDNQYTQYYYIQDEFLNEYQESFSLDFEIYSRLKYKEEVMLKAIDDSMLEPVYTPEEDVELIFKNLF